MVGGDCGSRPIRSRMKVPDQRESGMKLYVGFLRIHEFCVGKFGFGGQIQTMVVVTKMVFVQQNMS